MSLNAGNAAYRYASLDIEGIIIIMPGIDSILQTSRLHCLVFVRIRQTEIRCPQNTDRGYDGNLKLQWNDPKVQDLHCGPEDVIGSECGDVDILEFLDNVFLSSSLCQCHECEEDAQTDWCEEQLIHGNSLKRRYCPSLGQDWKPFVKPSVPQKLRRGHQEAVRHESSESFEVERRGSGV